MIVIIDILVAIASILSKTFVDFTSIVSTLAYAIVIAKLSIALIFDTTKSFAKRLLLNEIIIYDFESDVAHLLRKTMKFFFTL